MINARLKPQYNNHDRLVWFRETSTDEGVVPETFDCLYSMLNIEALQHISQNVLSQLLVIDVFECVSSGKTGRKAFEKPQTTL